MFRRSSIQIKTYEAGLIQARAYRVLNSYLTECLNEYSLSVSEWGLFGQVANSDNQNATLLAKTLGVEVPRVTLMVDNLEKLGYVERQRDSKDSRVRIVRTTARGRKSLAAIEADLRHKLRDFLGDVSIPELLTYIKVLRKIANHGEMEKTI